MNFVQAAKLDWLSWQPIKKNKKKKNILKNNLLRIHKDYEADTVDSRYLEVQWTLRNISRYPYLDISDY